MEIFVIFVTKDIVYLSALIFLASNNERLASNNM